MGSSTDDGSVQQQASKVGSKFTVVRVYRGAAHGHTQPPTPPAPGLAARPRRRERASAGSPAGKRRLEGVIGASLREHLGLRHQAQRQIKLTEKQRATCPTCIAKANSSAPPNRVGLVGYRMNGIV